MKKTLVLLLAIALAACTPKIDGSSESAFLQSIEEITKGMSPQEQQAFGQKMGLAAAMEMGASGGEHTVALVLDPRGFSKQLREALDGKTASDIETLAAQEQQRREKAQFAALDKSIASEEASLAQAETRFQAFQQVSLSNVQARYDVKEVVRRPGDSYEVVDFQVNASLTNGSLLTLDRKVGISIDHQGRKDSTEVYLTPDEIAPGAQQTLTFRLQLVYGMSAADRGTRFDPDAAPVFSVSALDVKGFTMMTAAQMADDIAEQKRRIQRLKGQRNPVAQGQSQESPQAEASAPSGPADAAGSVSVQPLSDNRVQTRAGVVSIVPAEQTQNGQPHLALDDQQIGDLSDDHMHLQTLYRYADRDVVLLTHGCAGSACAFTSVVLLELRTQGVPEVFRHQGLTISSDAAEPDVAVGADGSLTLSFEGQSGPQRWRHANGQLSRL